MTTIEEVKNIMPIDSIIRIKIILDDIDTSDCGLVEKYNQLRKYDGKLKRSESESALTAYNIVDDILTERYIASTEGADWRYECTLRIVMSLMIYGAINIELDNISKEEFISTRTDLRHWYKKLKRVVK